MDAVSTGKPLSTTFTEKNKSIATRTVTNNVWDLLLEAAFPVDKVYGQSHASW
jgi:hypothetical protein